MRAALAVSAIRVPLSRVRGTQLTAAMLSTRRGESCARTPDGDV
jgi:hypothetical protein